VKFGRLTCLPSLEEQPNCLGNQALLRDVGINGHHWWMIVWVLARSVSIATVHLSLLSAPHLYQVIKVHFFRHGPLNRLY
jgi:hypothetical protein